MNGHDHIYTRTGQMIAGEQAMSFKDAYGTDPKNENAGIKDGFSETYNNKVYKDGKVVVDGIKLDYDKNEVTNPRGTLFLTMSTSAGSKYYNPIGEDQWFVVRSLDDRSQLFSTLTFSQNRFNVTTMDPSGQIYDYYTINKTDDFIENPAINNKNVDKAKLKNCINQVIAYNPVQDEENVKLYQDALDKAKEVLDANFTSQEEVNSAIEVLKTRLSEVKFEEKTEQGPKAPKASTAPKASIVKKSSKVAAKKTKSTNPKTGVASLAGVYTCLGLASAGLFASKKNK